jgi:hypothetical protein
MSDEKKTNVPLIGEIFVEGEAPPQYYQAFLNAQGKAEAAADRAEYAAREIVVDQEYIETQVFSAGQAANTAAMAARDAAESERNAKDDADRAAGAAGDAEAAKNRAEEVVGSAVSYNPQSMSRKQQAQARKNIGADVSPFGYRYSAAEKEYDISLDNDGSVMLYLFPHDGGYAAVVSGKGTMKNYALTLHPKGYKVTTEERAYAAYLKKINKVCIEKGVTTIGDYFMFGAHYLKDVVFEDSSTIKRLGKYCFAVTQISGEYKFCNLENGTTIDRSFYCCPKLQGITLGVDATDGRSIAISEVAFFACLGLKHFIVVDAVNTALFFGRACFYYCTGLKEMEFQPSNTTAEGMTFLMDPVTAIVKRRMDVEKGTLAHLPLGNLNNKSWPLGGDKWCSNMQWSFNTNGSTNANGFYSLQNCLGVASSYAGKRHELMAYETDEQKKEEYLSYERTANLDCKGVFWAKGSAGAFRVPYYGSCWLFAYMHIWNILHPAEMYNTIENFVAKLKGITITVDTELATAFGKWDFLEDVMATGVYADGYFDEGREIHATDLPVAQISSDTYTTLGVIGEASWGVRKALGWTGERLTVETLTSSNRTAWADIKKSAINSILAGKPVIFECVGYATGITGDTMGGAHAVAAIGYDAKTDEFKVIDSTWGLPSDDVPMEYWTSFEAMLEPSAESAVWVFSSFDDGATINPI